MAEISVAFLVTGTVQIKMSMYTQPATRPLSLRRLNLFASRQWTGPMPIGAFLIKHPDGPFLFDTGESICRNDPHYLSMFATPLQGLTRTRIEPQDSIIEQLKKHGVTPKDIKGVILSHLHGDHAGGLEQLILETPHVPIYVSEEHWNAFGNHPWKATLEGCVPQYWPKSFPPRFLTPQDQPIGPWQQSYPLTQDGRIAAIDTSGHVPGHVSLVVRSEKDNHSGVTYLLTGDATYSIGLLDQEQVDGVSSDPICALETIRKIKKLAAEQDIVVLPSHDPETPRLLANQTVYNPKSVNA